MAAEIKRLLLLRSTNYKDVELESLERLSNLADQQGVTTTSLAGAFDKFMTVSRCATNYLRVARIYFRALLLYQSKIETFAGNITQR